MAQPLQNLPEPLFNYLFITVEKEYEDQLVLKGAQGNPIVLDLVTPRTPSGDQQGHESISHYARKRMYGTVVAVPRAINDEIKLFQANPEDINLRGHNDPLKNHEHFLDMDYQKALDEHKPNWVTAAAIEMDIRVGDKVYFHYLTLEHENWMKALTGHDVYKLRYNCAFAVERDGVIIPIGGRVIAEPVYEGDVEVLPDIEVKEVGYKKTGAQTVRRGKSGLITEVNVKPKTVEARVRHVGKPLKRPVFMNGKTVGHISQENYRPVEVGDRIVYDIHADAPININGEQLYCIEYRYILGKYENVEI